MKQWIVPVVLCLSVVTASIAGPVKDTDQIAIQVSPPTIVLSHPGVWVTVHTNIPFGAADGWSFELNGVDIALPMADALGFFVAKFDLELVAATVEAPSDVVVFTGDLTDGTYVEETADVKVTSQGP